jgi:single-strand DNA-binding protein
MSINKVILVGHVGKDPVVRYFDKGVANATFPLATSETFTNRQGETVTSTEWHNIVLWRALAEVAEKTVKKGSQIYIVGKIKTRSYVDKDGVNKYITEILADTLLLLEKKQGTTNQSQHTETGKTELQSKSQPTVINEPHSTYQTAGGESGYAKDPQNSDDLDPDPMKNESITGQNDDDLPF